MAQYIFSAETVDQVRRNPLHEALRDLGRTARDGHRLDTPEFKKLLGYITEVADGRDRREPMTDVPGTHRPQPRLRVLIDAAFGELGDLTWFRLNKIVNQSRLPLIGEFTRMAASVGRLNEEHLCELVSALVSDAPDKKLLKLLNHLGGRIPHCGLDLFSKMATLFRPDLYCVIPKRWGTESGCLKFIDDDLRKYCAVCRTLREICDEVAFPSDVRGVIFCRAVEMDPIHPTLEAALNRSIGAALAWANVLDAGEGFIAGLANDDGINMPLEVSASAIRVRRGEVRLRNQLIRDYRSECAISGKCAKDLLEVAYVAPYPAGDVHSTRNTVLLRTDLHTMWDLNLIGVDPDTMEVHISDKMRGTYYESFVGAKLALPRDGAPIDAVALKERWQHFAQHEKAIANRRDDKPKAAKAPATADSEESLRVPEIQTLAALEPKTGAPGMWRGHSSAAGARTAPASAFGDIGYETED